MAQHNELGKAGETAAIEYLKKKGYLIRHTNWRWGYLEIDVVAETDDEVIFIEVKTRNGAWRSPEEAVNNTKIRNLVSAADHYIKSFDLDLSARFDVISIVGNEPNFEIEHIEDAFYPPVTTYRR
jgi:putative endonuclease